MSRTGNKNIFLFRLKYNTPLWSCFKKKLETKKIEKYFRWEIFIKIFHFVKNISELFLAFQLTEHWTSAWLICFTLVVEGTLRLSQRREQGAVPWDRSPCRQESSQRVVFRMETRQEGKGRENTANYCILITRQLEFRPRTQGVT